MRYANRWSVLCAWAAAMGGAWAVLVPTFLSASSLLVLAMAAPALVIVASTVRRAHAPAPSFGQARVEAEATARGRS